MGIRAALIIVRRGGVSIIKSISRRDNSSFSLGGKIPIEAVLN